MARARARACQREPRQADTRHTSSGTADRERFGGNGVLGAVANVRETIGPAVLRRDPFDQEGLDALLVELDGSEDKSRLGANAVLAVSTAVARSAAASQGIPLWRHLGGGGVLPLPMVNIISGGLHADAALAFQDFLVVPIGASSFREAVEWAAGVRSTTGEILRERGLSTLKAAEGGFGPPLEGCEAALDLLVEAVERSGRSAGDEVAFAIDVAATHFCDGGCVPPRRTRRRVSTPPGSSRSSPASSTTIRSSRSRTVWPRTTGTGGRR